MITPPHNDSFSEKIFGSYPKESDLDLPPREASPNTVACDPLKASQESVVRQSGMDFIKAPQKFFGKFFEINVEKRTAGEKEANQAVRAEFYETLHTFFGAVLAEYLYPNEQHDQTLREGAPLTPQQAQKIVGKGMEMMEGLAKYCEHYLEDDPKNSSQADRLDQAMSRYAEEQEAGLSNQNGMVDLLPHAAKAIGGGAMAAFAVATMGHLTPTDIFFLVDLLSSKKLSKGLENFITTRLLQHMESHLESYLQEGRANRELLLKQQLPTAHPSVIKKMLDNEDDNLRKALTGKTQSLSHDQAYPSAKSGAIHTADLMVGGGEGIARTPFEALKFIFQGESFMTGAHNQLFRDGVTAVIENVKKIQDAASKTEISTQELSKIKKAIATAREQASTIDIPAEAAATWRDVPDQEPLKTKIAPTKGKKEKVFRPQWTRGI